MVSAEGSVLLTKTAIQPQDKGLARSQAGRPIACSSVLRVIIFYAKKTLATTPCKAFSAFQWEGRPSPLDTHWDSLVS